MKTIIKVTEAHIKKGSRTHIERCPVARAARECLNNPTVFCGGTYLSLDSFKRVGLPEKAQMFIADFDRGLPVVPFEFEVDV